VECVALYKRVMERNLHIFQRRYHRALVWRIFEAIGPKREILLDIGCGYGNVTNVLTFKGELVIGIDLQTIFFRPYISKKLDFCRSEALHTPFRDETFDCIVSLDVLEHINNDVAFVQEAYRVLKREGVLLIETPNRERLSVKLTSKISRHARSFPKCYGYDPVLGEILHFREYTKMELHRLFGSFNFREINISGLWLGLVTPEIGSPKAPKKLEHLCQSWIVKAVK